MFWLVYIATSFSNLLNRGASDVQNALQDEIREIVCTRGLWGVLLNLFAASC